MFSGLPTLRTLGKFLHCGSGVNHGVFFLENYCNHHPENTRDSVDRNSDKKESGDRWMGIGLVSLSATVALGCYLAREELFSKDFDSDSLEWAWPRNYLGLVPRVQAAEDPCFKIKSPPPCGITTCETCKKKPKCDPCPPPKPKCAPPCDPCNGLKGGNKPAEKDSGLMSWVGSIFSGGSDPGCKEESKKKPETSCLCDKKNKEEFGRKKACPPPLPPSPPCPCIADCFGDETITDVSAIREKCYQELCEALKDLESEKEAAKKVIEKADAQFETRKDKCCQVMDDVVQRANKLRGDACAKIKEVEEKAILLREEAKRRVREAQMKECEERGKMEARKLELMNEALEFKVNLAYKCMREALDMAVASELALANIIRCYVKAIEDAVRSIRDPCDLENDYFAQVAEILEARQCLVEETMMKSGLFREAADTYRKIIEDGRLCPEVCNNPVLEGAEKKIRCMIDELDEASNHTRLVMCEVQGLKNLKDALRSSWQFILPMLQTIVPDADPCDPCSPITVEQMNVMVIYLMQKYLRAAVELEQCKAQMPPTCDDKPAPLDCEALLYGSKLCQPECRNELELLVQKRILEMLRSCCPADPCVQPEPC
ncbi:unnamed protein product [Notodromas monacha]|uniref:Uncharacterized protein n=1 Tax=Notodromas monacha TaxID=399045 RepID=A0A7R9GFQ4_9CRUS|nr:unnamed protein product [Notodromas monacha]CAG0919120.1 unnamed protein product [Notodromas monacha]